MAKRIRPQNQKDKASSRVKRVQDIRRSNAAGPMPSRARYDRNGYRAMAQSGRYSEDD